MSGRRDGDPSASASAVAAQDESWTHHSLPVESKKEMSPGGAAGNCYEFVLVRFSFDFGKRISDSNLFLGG